MKTQERIFTLGLMLQEAPMAHIGATIGCLTPLMSYGKFQPFSYFHQDPERRDMGAAGTAAGFTAAFGTPIGYIFISLILYLYLYFNQI